MVEIRLLLTSAADQTSNLASTHFIFARAVYESCRKVTDAEKDEQGTGPLVPPPLPKFEDALPEMRHRLYREAKERGWEA